MTTTIKKSGIYAICAAAILLSTACDTNPVKPDTAPAALSAKTVSNIPRETPEQLAAKAARLASENALADIIAQYDSGDFNGVIKRVSGPNEIRSEDRDLQIRAMKYMAFSYCVTNRQTLCRQQFDKILKLDSTFDLAPGEKGHPQWQAAFDRVKKAQK